MPFLFLFFFSAGRCDASLHAEQNPGILEKWAIPTSVAMNGFGKY
jgi:hypothetical protein